MAKQTYFFTGKFKWAKLQSPDQKYSTYSLQFYPKSDEDRRAIKATGTKCNAKEDDDGWFYTFRNPEKPEVIDNKGEVVTALVGNGSEGSIKILVESFESPKWGKVVRTRLLGVKLDKLIEYVPEKKEAAPEAAPAAQDDSEGMPW